MDRTIAPEDHMVTASEEAYFRTAEGGYKAVVVALEAASRAPDTIRTILDFGSGYGRVYRALAAGFPQAEMTACDLMESGAKFCATQFGGRWVKSEENLDLVKLPHKYDLIWLGSVFTHLPAHRWSSMLDFLARWCAPNGLVALTSHGDRAIDHFENFILKRNPHIVPEGSFEAMKKTRASQGFAFIPNRPATLQNIRSKGIDVTDGEYGFSFASEPWARKLIEGMREWEFVHYAPAGWANNHDVISLRRVP